MKSLNYVNISTACSNKLKQNITTDHSNQWDHKAFFPATIWFQRGGMGDSETKKCVANFQSAP